MPARALRTAVLLLVAVACGGGDLPTQPTTTNVPPATPAPPPPAGGTSSIEGEYRLTFTASPGCSLPLETIKRTYTAKLVEATRGYVTVTLSGAVFTLGRVTLFTPGFTGTRDGDAVRFDIALTNDRGVMELIEGTKEVLYVGVASATVADRNIVGTFNGQIYVAVAGDPYAWLGDCTATDHRIEFTRSS